MLFQENNEWTAVSDLQRPSFSSVTSIFTKHLCSKCLTFTPFRHVRAPFLEHIFPRQVVSIAHNVLALPLFNEGRYEYRDFLQHHHLPKREPLCCQGHYTFHPLNWTQIISITERRLFLFCPESCSLVDPFHPVCYELLSFSKSLFKFIVCVLFFASPAARYP